MRWYRVTYFHAGAERALYTRSISAAGALGSASWYLGWSAAEVARADMRAVLWLAGVA